MSRQFGLSSRPALGAGNTQGGSLPRVAVSREPIQLAGKTSRPANSRGESPELSTANARYRAMERAAMVFVIAIPAFIGAFFCAAMWLWSELIY